MVYLNECSSLVEISEFPREIYGLDASGCHALRSISRLSNILEGKESKMIPWMDLSGCDELCRNLAADVGKMKKNLPDDSLVTALLSLFLSCRQSEFQVVFHGSEFPEWFTCCTDFERFLYPRDVDKKGFEAYNFCIGFPPQDFKWENKGLAFCAQTQRDRFGVPYFRFRAIYINGVCIIKESKPMQSQKWGFPCEHVWLYYVPFDTIIRRLGESGLPPPSICLVKLEFEYQTPEYQEGFVKQSRLREGSCGVHVVMPEDEGVFVNCPSSNP